MKRFVVVILIIAVGCDSGMTAPQTTSTALPAPTISPAPTLSPTGTSIPLPTFTPTITPIASITPQPGFDIWDAGSVVGSYTVQFPKDRWIESGVVLKHRVFELCSIDLHGGTDMCMTGGCDQTGIILGDAGFTKTMLGNSGAIYVSRALRSWISYEIYAFNEEQPGRCIQEGEEVLATLILRPERGCSDRAELLEDIPLADTSLPAGSTFTKTWRVKNIGTCVWTHAYSLFLVGLIPGADFYQRAPLPKEVYPNQAVNISVEMTVPSTEGIARWEWMLKNEMEDLFGVGERHYTQMPGDPLWVQITVGTVATP